MWYDNSMIKNTAKKISITLAPELLRYVKDMAHTLNTPVSQVIAYAIISQKKRIVLDKRKEKLIKAYKQIAENHKSDDLIGFEKLQWELSKEID